MDSDSRKVRSRGIKILFGEEVLEHQPWMITTPSAVDGPQQ
ncbi:hypothetical protein R5R35_008832 [Gryllus longicercus]|uniref:Uncharacterized protein n=1 Tax=Gryllus longicercus TaxID=2509291 RepID=A0AAN9YWQ8_9ORTH